MTIKTFVIAEVSALLDEDNLGDIFKADPFEFFGYLCESAFGTHVRLNIKGAGILLMAVFVASGTSSMIIEQFISLKNVMEPSDHVFARLLRQL